MFLISVTFSSFYFHFSFNIRWGQLPDDEDCTHTWTASRPTLFYVGTTSTSIPADARPPPPVATPVTLSLTSPRAPLVNYIALATSVTMTRYHDAPAPVYRSVAITMTLLRRCTAPLPVVPPEQGPSSQRPSLSRSELRRHPPAPLPDTCLTDCTAAAGVTGRISQRAPSLR